MRLFKSLLFAAVVAGCAGSGQVRYSATAEVSTPELVEVEPGVMVVADYDEPVFYSEGVYWRYYGGEWFRSPYYNRAWVRISTPPIAVRRISRPETYVHYRAHMRDRREARAYPPPTTGPDYRNNPPPPPAPRTPRSPDVRTPPPAPAPLPSAPDVREHREGPPMTPPGQARRDAREDRREDKAERRDERRDEKVERREDKAERRDERRDEKVERREDRRDDKVERRDDRRDKHDNKGNHGHP